MLRLTLWLLATTPLNHATAGRLFTYAHGTCEAFNVAARTQGAKDSTGRSHTGSAGFTECRAHVELPPGASKLSIRRTPQQVCVTADLSRAELATLEVMTTLRWDTGTTRLSSSCDAEIQRYEDAVVAHEQQHVADCRSIRDAINREWASSPRVIQRCGPANQSERALTDAVNAEVATSLTRMTQRFDAENERAARALHERHGAEVKGLNCEVCQPQR